MKKRLTPNASNEIRVELKYCERCGALWLRECGGGQIYCDHCVPEIAELPAPRLKRTYPQLPAGRRPLMDESEFEFSDMDELDLESSGGVA